MPHHHTAPRAPLTGALTTLVLLTTLAFPASAQEADALFRGLVPFGSLQAQVGTETLDDANFYFGERAGAYLLLSDTLGQPLLINIRAREVQSVEASKVRTNDDGTLELLADTAFETVGPFEVQGSELRFTLADGRKIVLAPKPSLVGLHPASALIEHNSTYGFGADRYPPDEALVSTLREETRDVKVRVYFGSWCSTCTRVLPWILRVERELEGSKVRFEYYGLPRAMDDPAAREARIDGVPTAIVSVDGKEVGRSTVPDLGVPEKAISTLIQKASDSDAPTPSDTP